MLKPYILSTALLLSGAASFFTQAQEPASISHAPQLVTDEVLRRADEYTGEWLMYTKNYAGQRFSPLNQINRDNVSRLAPKWAFSMGTRGSQQSTPLVHRGVMYVTSTQGRIFALRADTGDLLWEFDSQLPPDAMQFGLSDANRGAAIYKDKVIWSNMTSTIFCHEASTGKLMWQKTSDDYRLGYTKGMAPLIVRGKVITGMAGGEFGTRGYVEAHDADTGKQVWKSYTIPGPGEPGHETWPKNSDAWKHGGAQTWITGSYDPELNLIYWTTGNGGPWSGEARPGSNLHCASVLALDADTGKIRWYYQFVPNDDWDFDASVTPVLAEVEHDGRVTPVIAMALKSGFLYVLDRRDGRFLKGVKFSDTPEPPFWAKGLDPKTGRPIESPHARPNTESNGRTFVAPSVLGGANWWSMAFHPTRQWIVIVSNETGNERFWDKPMEYKPGTVFGPDLSQMGRSTRRTAERPGRVSAYDLRTMKKQWEAEPEPEVRWGGPLVTAGDLVFAGTMRGFLQALDATNGRTLYQFQTGSGIMAFPITYAVGGKQYIAIVSGKGGVADRSLNFFPDFFRDLKNHNTSGMVFGFALP